MELETIKLACKYKKWKLVSHNTQGGTVIYKFSKNNATWNVFKHQANCKFRFLFTINRNGTRNSSTKRKKMVFSMIWKAYNEYHEILKGKICPYCKGRTKLIDVSKVYGVQFGNGKIYSCAPCEAHVGCHGSSNKSMGFVAKKDLREARRSVHKEFDKIWKAAIDRGGDKSTCRQNAYMWLADIMGLNIEYMHIAMLDLDQCKAALAIIKPFTKQISCV